MNARTAQQEVLAEGRASMNRKRLPVALLKRYFGSPYDGVTPQVAAMVNRMKSSGYIITRCQLDTWTTIAQ